MQIKRKSMRIGFEHPLTAGQLGWAKRMGEIKVQFPPGAVLVSFHLLPTVVRNRGLVSSTVSDRQKVKTIWTAQAICHAYLTSLQPEMDREKQLTCKIHVHKPEKNKALAGRGCLTKHLNTLKFRPMLKASWISLGQQHVHVCEMGIWLPMCWSRFLNPTLLNIHVDKRLA